MKTHKNAKAVGPCMNAPSSINVILCVFDSPVSLYNPLSKDRLEEERKRKERID